MAFKLNHFEVTGLFGRTTISVPIVDNRLVIVGANGLGKSTFLNILYFFISRQWSKLADYEFECLTATFSDRSLTLDRNEIVNVAVLPPELTPSHLAHSSPRLRSALDFVRHEIVLAAEVIRDTEQVVRSAARRYGLGPVDMRYLRDYLQQVAISPSDNLREIDGYLTQAISEQILYLPTYRRIEKDLNTVFPGMEDELRRFRDTRRPSAAGPYLELVEFGMEDVEQTVHAKLSELRETARAELNGLAGSYLRDVLRGEGNTYDAAAVSALSDSDVADILNRVEERTLDETDRRQLRDVIDSIRANRKLESSQEYVAHFFARLVQVRKKMHEDALLILSFAAVCNQYLDGKTVKYDDVDYTLSIVLTDQTPISFSSLSSGEKQIVSLFSQVYLGRAKSYVIIIDEPELSLSVPWQKRLFVDLETSKRCSFIAAVTHSPFIFDNAFDQYAVVLGDFISGT